MKKLTTKRVPRPPLLFFVPLLFAACTKEEAAEVEQAQVVVESYLSPGQAIQVRLTEEVPFAESGSISPVDGLVVIIEHDGGTDTLHGSGNGTYTGPVDLAAQAGSSYSLRFTFSEAEVSATTTVPASPNGFALSTSTLEIPVIDFSSGPPTSPPVFPDPITLSWNNPDQAYHLVVVENMETDPEPIGEEDAPRRPSFRIEPTTANATELSFRSFSYFGSHRIILYRLNADYAALYLDSGSNSQNLATPQTNIVNGLGIFTGINSDTLMLEVVEQ